MRLTIGQKLTLSFATAVAILLATAVVSYRNTRELLRTTDAVAHSQQVLSALDGVARAASDAEAQVRGHVLVGGGAYRDGFRASAAEAQRHVDVLRLHSSVDRSLAAASDTLAVQLKGRLAILASIMKARDRAGVEAGARLLVATDTAAARHSLPELIGALRSREGERLRVRSAAAHEGADRADFILRFGILLVLVLAPLAFLIVRNDFVTRLAGEAALAETEARFRAAADGSLDAFYVLRALRDGAGAVLDFEFVDVNARAESLLGHARDDVLGQRLCELVPANRSEGFFDKYRLVMETGAVLEEEFEVTSRDYRAAWIHHQVVPLPDGVAITSRDITERKRQEEALRALSLVDELTGLYNRRGFLTLAQQQLKLARRSQRELVLLFIDMDDFKEINDTFGHNEGDIALTRAAGILRHTFRDSDIIARLGGDEFVVLATDTGETGSEIIVNRLRRELFERNTRDGYPYRLSFSVGAARFDPEAPPSIEELLATADAMLYEQKKHKRQTAPSMA